MSNDFLPRLLADHLARYPKMEARDIYKLLFQAALGAEHAVRDEAAARDWLVRELDEMGSGPQEPLLDPISPDGRIVRVHLRPFVQAGGAPEALLRAFVRTANEVNGDREDLPRWGAAAADFADTHPGPPTGEAIRSFFATMESQYYPTIHHSAAYLAAYRPAYRVVARDFLEGA